MEEEWEDMARNQITQMQLREGGGASGAPHRVVSNKRRPRLIGV